MPKRILSSFALLAFMSAPVVAEDVVLLHAAGSLRGAMTDMAKSFEGANGGKVQAKFGASGTLKDEIVKGDKAEVFASANMEHPQALAEAKRSGPAVLFARNKLCALVRPGLKVESSMLLDRMLDSQIKLGTSTPKADPSGDYAWEVFHKADKLKAGAFATLEKKALQLVGGPSSPTAPPGRTIYGILVTEGKADIFLTYCTNAMEAQKENADFGIVALPDALAVGADYGLSVMNDASASAYKLALFILSTEGQRVLARYGFAAPSLPQ